MYDPKNMNWIKKLFIQKKTLEELKNWQQNEIDRIKQEYDKKSEYKKTEFEEIIKKTKQQLEKLAEAELRNPNIPERAKNYIPGNTEQFTKSTIRYLEQINIPRTINDFNNNDKSLKEYFDNSARAGAILSEFFRKEVADVRTQIANIEKIMNELKVIHSKKD